MGFLDNVKAAANDLKSSVDQQLSSSSTGRDVEKHFRDLGMLAYLKGTGREIVAADWDRVLSTLQSLEASGAIPTFALQTAAPPPPGAAPTPPPPGACGTTAASTWRCSPTATATDHRAAAATTASAAPAAPVSGLRTVETEPLRLRPGRAARAWSAGRRR